MSYRHKEEMDEYTEAAGSGWPIQADTYFLKHLKVPFMLRNNCQSQGLHFLVLLASGRDQVTIA